MIQLHVAEAGQEGTYEAVSDIGCVLEREALFCTSHEMSKALRMLAVC